ncbi:hypothetical protein [Marinobacter sp. KMM 10035]|uniref:hypothetical protein n=1 Tax=Marinobacter sp. KMM 10035 TaxID=3134034 RepID=UPI00397D4561
MADAWGWVYPGDTGITSACSSKGVVDSLAKQHDLVVVPLVRETAKTRHADQLYQVLKDLTGLAKLAASTLNTYQAALRNADELLKLIESEQRSEETTE